MLTACCIKALATAIRGADILVMPQLETEDIESIPQRLRTAEDPPEFVVPEVKLKV
jgi:hypothetical protein